MFTRIVTSALFAGAATGIAAGALHLMFVQPVLLHAELYESGTLVHFGAGAVSAQPSLPGIDIARDGLSLVFTMFQYTGYALILAALFAVAEERGLIVDARRGLMWGLAGFVSVMLAPAFSLAPEVPGVAAADVGARQIWWFATVAAAALAMALFAFGRRWPLWIGAAVLLIAPHLIGAPEPGVFAGTAPTELGALFAARALGVGFAAWAILGSTLGYFWQTESRAREAAA